MGRDDDVPKRNNSGGGVDIAKLVKAKNRDPPKPTASITIHQSGNKHHRRKKNGAKDKKVVVLGHGKPSVMLQKKDETTDVQGIQMQKQLFEANQDLLKERNTREMLELQLKQVKKRLGEDEHINISNLKEELESEKKLRISLQNELSESNNLVIAEQKKIRALEKDVSVSKKANNSIKGEMKSAKKGLQSVKQIQTELSVEKTKHEDLQKRLQYEAASSIALRMELQSIKGSTNRVKELEVELIKARISKGTDDFAAIRMELDAAHSQIQRLKYELAAAKAVKETPLALSTKHKTAAESDKDQLIRKLRKELYDVRQILKVERKKGSSSTTKKGISLSDWVDNAVPSSSNPNSKPRSKSFDTDDSSKKPRSQSFDTQRVMLLTPPRNMSRPRLPAQPELSSSPLSPPSPPKSSLFHFEEDDHSISRDKEMEPLHDELTFLRSAYDSDEIIIEDNLVTHLLELATDSESETISIALSLTIPNGYPNDGGPLKVKASIRSANCSHGIRKVALDALPKLEEICTYEAQANEGNEAIHPIFSIADGWANTDWYNILSKERPSISKDKARAKEESNSLSFEICVALIHTHHIVEENRIQFIKSRASKFSLGGFIKIGKPGFILVEGAEEHCNQLLETLSNNKKVFHTSHFKFAGKVVRTVNINYNGCLPHKMEELEGKTGMDDLGKYCEELGLLEELNDIVGN